jgi:hypothetical protein
MNAVRGAHLNNLLRQLPEGYVVDSGWLGRLGLSASSVRDYVQRGWLERIAARLYRRPAPGQADPLQWQAAILSLQNLLELPVHVGGLTALELVGYWQYAITGRRRLWLYSDSRSVRSLLDRLPMDASATIRSRKLFANPDLGIEQRPIDLATSTLGPVPSPDDIKPVMRNRLLRMSSLERAILEVLDEVPGTISFEHGAELFEGLTTLRPRLATALLEACTSVKAKRLFLYLASQHNHSWVRVVRRAEAGINIGSGKRQIVPGGQLDPTYQITVPPVRARASRKASS